uniref:Large ribosomal subunit protein mL53 n=1 Tax=Entomoneis paludosa TaxID=265537 RepID=A0A7S3DNA3_9STRA|mmetsp:Transcript_22927/g.47834  ORF Transcript_22927/g.47834 Transcript_22927/m.47834 type:complete len:120 (+) Transcript_22927:149-508(+)|eukprot:CAMPEP_0172446766 /NCGR_PEP_ID=MMETSP1065-20121228/6287_1 /TAXON_ID=265537 /ORGANISM="Amphiprora paludosa, Strain CCMP125" /LENGTH=119 /DNA_ID=CAMNT_0013197955 /DNA_START=91 /DNA_END=450 /DNA_ORIENTATION=+
MGKLLSFDKAMTTHLFKYVNKIKYSFNPFDRRSTSARDVMDRLHAPRFQKANPRLTFEYDVHNRPKAPFVEFHFHNGKDFIVNPSHDHIGKDIIFDVCLRLAEIDAEYEIEGKNIDDER